MHAYVLSLINCEQLKVVTFLSSPNLFAFQIPKFTPLVTTLHILQLRIREHRLQQAIQTIITG